MISWISFMDVAARVCGESSRIYGNRLFDGYCDLRVGGPVVQEPFAIEICQPFEEADMADLAVDLVGFLRTDEIMLQPVEHPGGIVAIHQDLTTGIGAFGKA